MKIISMRFAIMIVSVVELKSERSALEKVPRKTKNDIELIKMNGLERIVIRVVLNCERAELSQRDCSSASLAKSAGALKTSIRTMMIIPGHWTCGGCA